MKENFKEVQVETDCQTLVGAVHGKVNLFTSQVGFLILDCRDLFEQFTESSIKLTDRSANTVADALTENAPISSRKGFWRTVPPQFLNDLLYLDSVERKIMFILRKKICDMINEL